MTLQELLQEEREEGRKEGHEEGRKEGRAEGQVKGREIVLLQLVAEDELPMEKAASVLEISLEEFRKRLDEYLKTKN